MELDDRTPLDATNVRAALTTRTTDERVVVHLSHNNGNELLVGLRGDRGVCLWQSEDGDGDVTTGGHHREVTVYGWAGVPFPPASEINADTVINAAEECAVSGARPTSITWTDYHGAFPIEEPTITPEQLRALLDEPDAGR